MNIETKIVWVAMRVRERQKKMQRKISNVWINSDRNELWVRLSFGRCLHSIPFILLSRQCVQHMHLLLFCLISSVVCIWSIAYSKKISKCFDIDFVRWCFYYQPNRSIDYVSLCCCYCYCCSVSISSLQCLHRVKWSIHSKVYTLVRPHKLFWILFILWYKAS